MELIDLSKLQDSSIDIQERLELIDRVQAVLSEAREGLEAAIKDEIKATGRPVRLGEYDYKLTETYRKAPAGRLDEIDSKFLKTETKINTKAINEHKKEFGKLPKGVLEVLSHTSLRKSNWKKKQERSKAFYARKPQIENPLAHIKFKPKD